MGKLIVFAHRGQGPTSRVYQNKKLPPDIIPENSIKAFEKGLKDGSEGFELDVFLTKDERVVVCHDNELDRNVNGRYNCWAKGEVPQLGLISEKTLDEVQALDIGNEQYMPTLEEVLDLTEAYNKENGTNRTINIEIKGKGPIVDKVHEIMKTNVENGRFTWDSFMINSFDADALKRMHELHPDGDLRISQGFFTWSVFGEKDNTTPDTWLPIVREKSPDGPPVMRDDGRYTLKNDIDVNLMDKKIEEAKKAGCTAIDVVSSDLTESLMKLCEKHSMAITATTNAIRARAQEEIINPVPPNTRKTDEEIEKQEVKKMFDLGEKYPNVNIYYKADKPEPILAYRKELEAQSALQKVAIDESTYISK